MLVTSLGLEGSRIVLESLASLENALTYCSATVSEAAASPFCGHRRDKIRDHRLREGCRVGRGSGEEKSGSWKEDRHITRDHIIWLNETHKGRNFSQG